MYGCLYGFRVELDHGEDSLRLGPNEGYRQSAKARCRFQYSTIRICRSSTRDSSHSANEARYFCFGRVGGGVLTVRFTYRAGVIRILGAGYWRKGKAIYERENQVHR